MTAENIDEVEAAPGPTESEIEGVVAIVQRQYAAEAEVSRLELALKSAQGVLKGIAEDELPKAILTMGVREVPLRDGNVVTVKTSYHSGISEANRDPAHSWLRTNEHGDIIDNVVEAKFGQGEEELAIKVADAIRAMAPGNKITRKESVHHSRLKSFVEEQILAGTDIPLSTFGVYTRTVAVIAAPKSGKRAKLNAMAEDKF